MSNTYAWFCLRLTSDEVISAIGERVGRVLSCGFEPNQDLHHPDKLILEGEVFCLKLTISQALCADKRIFQVSGENVIIPRWDYSSEINLSDWILQEFRLRDSRDWYIPSADEYMNEAGIE
jgi:hypothetical protein